MARSCAYKTVFVPCRPARRPRHLSSPVSQSSSSTTANQMDTIKRKYKNAKGKVKDLLRPPSRQSALITPARSHRSSLEPAATLDDGISTTSSAISKTLKRETLASVCNDLLTVVHGASDAFPPLKSALGGILEIWKQCEVRYLLRQGVFLYSYCSFREPPRLNSSLESSRASSWRL